MIHPMATSNVKIINELKKFMEDIPGIKSKKARYVYNPKAFTRRRKLTFTTLSLLILNGLKRSLSIEIQFFFEHFSQGLTCTKQAFSKQRTFMNPIFFHDWNRVLVDSFYYHYGNHIKRWKGFKLWAIDGSSVPLPQRDGLKEKFGCPTNQKGESYPLARICALYDVLNQIVIKGLLHPYKVSEENVSLDVLENQALEDVLLLYDRGYPSYWLMYLLINRCTHFVMRAQKNANNLVKSFLDSGSCDEVIELYPPYSSLIKLRGMGIEISKDTSIKIRMVKIVLDTGETEVLLSNLYDSGLYTMQDLKIVYHMRWNIETFYGYIKEELQLGQFSGIRAICIEQDFAANVFLSNLQSLIEKQSEPYLEEVSKKRKYTYKINKNASWACLKYRVADLFLSTDSILLLYELQKLFERNLEPIRPGRRFPRKRNRAPNNKYYTLTNYKRAI